MGRVLTGALLMLGKSRNYEDSQGDESCAMTGRTISERGASVWRLIFLR